MSNLTGEYRFRNEGDLLVLQVCEYKQTQSDFHVGLEDVEQWRDAKTEDLLDVQFDRSKDKYSELFQIPESLRGIRNQHHKEN